MPFEIQAKTLDFGCKTHPHYSLIVIIFNLLALVGLYSVIFKDHNFNLWIEPGAAG